MPWDEELEQLATFVREHFGDEELKAAGRRALTRLTPLDVADEGETEETDDVIRGADGHLYDVDAFWDAVRLELRRLVTPQ